MATRTKPTAHDNPNQLSTAERIRLILAENPNQTLQAVAKQVGVSRERVRQHQERLGLYRPNHPKRPHAPREQCAECRTELSVDSSRKARRTKRLVVCRDCRRAERVTMPCGWCGADVTRPRYAVNKQAFCNNNHQGKWLGKNYGLGTRPQDLPKKRDFCQRGHPMTGDNVYEWCGNRACRACKQIRESNRRARQSHA